MLARRHVFTSARLTKLAVAIIALCISNPSEASVTSIGSVNPVPPAVGGSFSSAWAVGDQDATNADSRAWVSITNGTLLQYSSLIIGDEEDYLGVVNVEGDFLAGQNTALTLSASSAGGGSGNSTLQVGRDGTGYLNISGGIVNLSSSFSDMAIGNLTTGIGYVTVTDPFAMLSLSEDLLVGNEGIGQLEVLNGALLRTTSTSTSHSISIGATDTGVGTVIVDGIGSVLSAGSRLFVGNVGAGTLTISDQAIVDVDNVTGARVTVGPFGRVNLAGGMLIGQTPTSGVGTTVNGIFGGSGLVRGSVAFGATGTLELGADDLLQFTGDVSNQGSATIDGGELQFLAGFTNNAAVAGSPLTPAGRISLEDATVRFSETLANDGVISSAHGTNNVHGEITNAGTIVVASDTVATFHDTVNNTTGTIDVLPRGNALFLSDLTFTASSALVLSVASDGATNSSAQIGVGGGAALDGSLTVNVGGSFVPTLGQTFDLITAADVSGLFSSVTVPDILGTLEYRIIYNPGSVQLVVADELTSAPTGDFNGDFVVDAADYVAWRKGLGTIYTQADYDAWRAHFNPAVPANSASTTATAPEPTTVALLVLTIAILAPLQRRFTSR